MLTARASRMKSPSLAGECIYELFSRREHRSEEQELYARAGAMLLGSNAMASLTIGGPIAQEERDRWVRENGGTPDATPTIDAPAPITIPEGER
jgi:hypothetical protein